MATWHKKIVKSFEIDAEYYNSELKNYYINTKTKYYLRIVKDKRMGFVYTNDEKRCNEKEALKNSIEFSHNLPEISNYKDEQIYIDLDKFNPENYLLDIKHKKLKNFESSISYSIMSTLFYDYNDNQINEKRSYGHIYINLVFDDFCFYIGCSGYDLNNIKNILYTDANLVLNSPNKIKIKENIPVVIIDSIFYDFFLTSFYGNKIKEKSCWTYSVVGEKICNFDILEDPNLIYPHIAYDSDGIKTRKKYIIENGEFKTPVFDYYYGKTYNEDSTGNGFHLGLNGIDYSNILIDSKEKIKLEELDKCILGYNIIGLHTCNWDSGDINATVSCGIYLEKGEVKGIVTKYDFSFNLKETLSKIKLLDMKREDGNLVYYPFILDI